MAWMLTVTVHDDLDGGAADETVRFCLDGTSYEIDLSTAHASGLRDVLAVYVARARSRSGGSHAAAAVDGAGGDGAGSPPRSETAVVRSWARENGFAVSRVGRLPTDVARAYARATRAPDNAPGTGPTPSGSLPGTATTTAPATAPAPATATATATTAPDQTPTMEDQ